MENQTIIKEVRVGGGGANEIRTSFTFLKEVNDVLYWTSRSSARKEILLLRTDKNLEAISCMAYKVDVGVSFLATDLVICPNNDILLHGNYVETSPNSASNTQTFIFRIGPDNQLKWKKFYHTYSRELKRLKGDKYLLFGFTVQSERTVHLVIIDGNGDVIKSVIHLYPNNALLENWEGKIVLITLNSFKNVKITELDDELNFVQGISFRIDTSFLDPCVLAKGNELILSFKQLDVRYFTKITIGSPFPLILDFNRFNSTLGPTVDSLFYIENYFYLYSREFNTPNRKFFYKLTSNLDLDWVKIPLAEISITDVKSFRSVNEIYGHLPISGFDGSVSSQRGIIKITQDFADSLCFQTVSVDPLSLNIENRSIPTSAENEIAFEVAPTNINDVNISENPVSAFTITQICPDIPILSFSSITAEPNIIFADGITQTNITVQLNEGPNNPIDTGEFNVEIISSLGTVSAVNSDHANGIYTATLTSLEVGQATLSFLVDGQMSPNTATVQFSGPIPIAPTAEFQSPHIYLQAAGSTPNDGDESTPGIHLRWTFTNKLGDEHLPKGNLATGTANFNKPDDFVKVYRAPYVKQQLTISLGDAPHTMNHASAFWLYKINGNDFYVVFRDKDKYLGIIPSIDPRDGNRLGFLAAYGDGLIEVETRDELAFGVELTTNQSTSASRLQTEILSVEANRLSLAKNVIGRKTFAGTALNDTHQCGDNIRSVRFKAVNCHVTTIKLELYQTFLFSSNEEQSWVSLGDFALTTNDDEAFQRLEGSAGTVHGKWPRYNDDCLVNIDNYRDQWNGVKEEGDRNLKEIVEQYIQLSNTAGNPRALETIEFSDPATPEGLRDLQEISNLNILFLAGTDYHMARMMGLGHMDLNIEAEDQKFVYMVEYHTTANLGNAFGFNDGLLNPEGTQHLFMTVPTSMQDSRLPYPVDLLNVEPGIRRTGLDENSTLTDPEGYTDIGRQRYLSIYAKEQVEHENESFYETPDQFNYAEATHPVYAGISYREKGKDWVKPEISSSADYLTAGPNPTSETVPLPLPLLGEPLFVHRVLEEGTHEYLGYGINWFGRSSPSLDAPLEIRTEFPIQNTLKPPAALNVLHVVEEDPLILTSMSEQDRRDKEGRDDDPITRLLFSFNHEQELISYPVSSDDQVLFTRDELLEPDLFRPDGNEFFANEFEVFFRDSIPQNIRGKILSAVDDPADQAVSVLTMGKYILYSSGEEIEPILPSDISAGNFTGGVLVLGEQQFIIHSVSIGSNGYVVIKVYKKAVGEALQGNSTNGPLEGPDISGDAIFMAIENMLSLSSWGTGNSSSFKIQIPEEVSSIHRSLIESTGGSGLSELQLEKYRGIYDKNVVITPVLETSEVDENNEETASLHRGTYRIQLNKTLSQHPQFNLKGNSVEWQGGSIRIPSAANPNGTKRALKVVKIENVGSGSGLVLYVVDDSFDQEILDATTNEIIGYQSSDPILTTGNFEINFYPGYKVYHYADSDIGLTESALQPVNGESLKYSIFGIRSKGDEYQLSDSNPPVFVGSHYSNISTPATMFSQAVIPPLRPQLPTGPSYATRPDSFGKATYTTKTTFDHKPFAVQYSRADEQGILNALYEPNTIKEIKNRLNTLSKDVYQTDRWQNLIGFDYSQSGGEFGRYPDTETGYKFPNPDKISLFNFINLDIDKFNNEEKPNPRIENVTAGNISPSTVIIAGRGMGDDTTLTDYIKQAIFNAFIPLTEIPLIYDQIRDENSYQPINKKQVIRDRNGRLLKPSDSDYDIAPMAKVTGVNEIQFTDFTLDGTSSNIYFYAIRELSSTMQMGDFSPINGPINLVNTNPPVAPEIKRAIPRLASKDHGLKQIPLDFVSVENLTILEDSIIHEEGVQNVTKGGAASRQILEGDGMISYQVNSGSTIIIGLSSMHINKETETVDYGIISTLNGDLKVRNRGVLTDVGQYDSDTLLQIQRVGNQLYFLKDNIEVDRLTIETPTDLLVTVSVRHRAATVTNLKLFTASRYYDREILQRDSSSPLPHTLTNLNNASLSAEGVLSKDSTTNAWDSGAITFEHVPFYGSLSFKVRSNEVVAAGLAEFNQERDFSSIEYGIRTGEDGLLYVINNGVDLIMGVPYNDQSELTIERRNQLLLFKNDGRTFYQLTLEENKQFWADFSIYSQDGTISSIEINETSRVTKNYLNTSNPPAIALEFNNYQINQKITTLNLYRTLEPAKSSSIRNMDLVKKVDLRLAGQIGESSLRVVDDFEDLAQIPYGDPIYYRATVGREISYAIMEEGESDKVVSELAPSNASRLIISTIVESTNPNTPEIFYKIDETTTDTKGANISLFWQRIAYNPKYLIYKMNEQGNWVKIHEFESNHEEVVMKLTDTSLTVEELAAIDGDSSSVYHHFRVDVENSAGLFNLDKNLLTIPSEKRIN